MKRTFVVQIDVVPFNEHAGLPDVESTQQALAAKLGYDKHHGHDGPFIIDADTVEVLGFRDRE
jgi:hypothetical protein